jgi:hypothetical protein
MQISQKDADLFFKLMWGLQFYVNQQRQILPDVESVEEYAILPMAEKIEVRDALWETSNLIDVYVEKNPDGLSVEELGIVRKWKRFVAGTFQMFRFLKKHTIFIGEKSQVYGVLGLYDSLEDIFYGRRPPIMVQAVLLPFKGKIVYDGVLKGYNVLFGGGIRSSLKEEYMTAKQNKRIITTLEPEAAGPAQKERKRKPGKDWGPTVEEIVQVSERMRGGPAIQSAAFGLFRASARLTQAAIQQPEDLDELWHLEQQARRALSRLQTVLDRAER